MSWTIPTITFLAMGVSFFVTPYLDPEIIQKTLKPIPKYNLSLLLFINALQINYRSLGRFFRYTYLFVGYAVAIKNFCIPAAGFFIAQWLVPELAMSTLLILGVSSGFSAIFTAATLGLAPEIGALITLFSSFLVPLSLPFLFMALSNTIVDLKIGMMIAQMAWMIFIPVLAERLLHYCLPALKQIMKRVSYPLILINLSATAFIFVASSYDKLVADQFSLLKTSLVGAVAITFLNFFLSVLTAIPFRQKQHLYLMNANLVNNSGLAAIIAIDFLGSYENGIAIIYSMIWYFCLLLVRAGGSLTERTQNIIFRSKN